MGAAGNDDSGNDGYADEIAERYEALNEEQKARYKRKIAVSTDAWGKLSGEYRLGVLKTYANNRTDVGELDRKEYIRAFEREKKLDREADERLRAREAKRGAAKKNGRQAGRLEERARDPMAGIRPSGRSRNYGALERAHREVAQQNARMVLAEKLKKMLRVYERVRKKKGLKTAPVEERQRVRLDRAQAMDRAELQGREAARSARDPASRIALAHQHLAERTALEARMLGEAMSGRDAGANRYRREGQEALDTARVLQERRQYRDRAGSRVAAGQEKQPEAAQRQDGEVLASARKPEAALDGHKNTGETKKPGAEAGRQSGRGAISGVPDVPARPGVTEEARKACEALFGPDQGERRTEAQREGGEREALKEAQNASGGRFGVTSEAKEAVKHLLASRQNTGRTDGGRTGGRSR
jgi:hypothetical protein